MVSLAPFVPLVPVLQARSRQSHPPNPGLGNSSGSSPLAGGAGRVGSPVNRQGPQPRKCPGAEKLRSFWTMLIMTTGQIQLGYKWSQQDTPINFVLLGAADL